MLNRISCRISAALVATALVVSPAAFAADDFSPAELALFMHDQMARVTPPQTVRYSYRLTGSLTENFSDHVVLTLKRQADGSCCIGTTEFLSGARKLQLPEVEGGTGNPVILHFLERDIREMQALTKGQANYFRQRIRKAIYAGATVRQINLKYRGKDVAAQEIVVTPYVDDPNHARFEKFTNKQYRFVLSDAVPGGVVSMRTRVDDLANAKTPLRVEELLIEGAESELAPVASNGVAPAASH